MEGVLFDPGYAKHLTSFYLNIQFAYDNLNKYKNLGQKKVQFKLFFSQIIQLLDMHIGFYMGCMLWATYIKSFGNQQILQHPCLGKKYDKDETLEELQFIKEYLVQLNKDSKYYMSKEFKIDEKKGKIINLYEKFLNDNKGFVEVDCTDKIILPNEFLKLTKKELEEINAKIQEVTETGKLNELIIYSNKI